MYLSHGMDDFEGGLCKITKVDVGISAGKPEWFIEIEERPGYNYHILMESQEEWKAQYGTNRGHPDPDDREEFNRWD